MQTSYGRTGTGNRCKHATSGPKACDCQTCQIVKLTAEIARLKARIEELEAEIQDKTDYHMNDAVEQVIQRRLGPGHTPKITGGKDE